jgi:uncharacterized protein YjaG (DUF416 family)
LGYNGGPVGVVIGRIEVCTIDGGAAIVVAVVVATAACRSSAVGIVSCTVVVVMMLVVATTPPLIHSTTIGQNMSQGALCSKFAISLLKVLAWRLFRLVQDVGKRACFACLAGTLPEELARDMRQICR